MEAGAPILKLWSERAVCAPQSLSAGTFTSPIVSFSTLYFILDFLEFIPFLIFYFTFALVTATAKSSNRRYTVPHPCGL